MTRTASLALAALLAAALPAAAATDLAAGLKATAKDPSVPLPAGLEDVSYNDAVYLLDELNQTDFRLLANSMRTGQVELPYNIRQAFELKAPRMNARGAGR